MASGRLLLAATLTLSAYAALPAVSRAEDTTQGESEGKHVFQGEVNANAVFVRSRASEDAYPTMKLSKDTKVTVVGIKGQWLKIDPPEGSFAYVPKSYIMLRNDGTVGRATRDTIAHAGSQLNDLAAVPMATVHEGDDVQILGQYHEYFKIKPPKDSFLWINKQFVDPVKTVAAADPAPTPAPREEKPEKSDSLPPPAPVSDAAAPATQPSDAVADAGAKPATTQPAEYTAIAEYEKLEEQFTAASAKPIGDQPLPDLLAGYQKVAAADDLPSSMRSIAEVRIATLKVRNDARVKFLAVQENERKMTEQRKALVAERQEIEERIKKNDIQIFAAVGTLRPSSLQTGQGLLYRLTDPASGRTVCYVRTGDSKYGQFLGQFIGVRGAITNDPQLKALIENPVEALPVDPSKVNQSIAAQIVPPSLAKFAPPAVPSTPPVSAVQAVAPAPIAAAPVAPATQPAGSSTDTASTGGSSEPQ